MDSRRGNKDKVTNDNKSEWARSKYKTGLASVHQNLISFVKIRLFPKVWKKKKIEKFSLKLYWESRETKAHKKGAGV